MVSGGGSVAVAIGAVAEEGAAFFELFSARCWSLWIDVQLVVLCLVSRRLVPIVDPLPDVADEIVYAVMGLGQVGAHRRREDEAVFGRVRMRESALPYVGPVPRTQKIVAYKNVKKESARRTPGEELLRSVVSGGEFPLGFCRESSSAPTAVSVGVVPAMTSTAAMRGGLPGDLDHGVVQFVCVEDVGARTRWFAPVRSFNRQPPLDP